MEKLSNILYIIFIPVTPLVLHVVINFFIDKTTKLEYIYPELFFATISICFELMRILDIKIRNKGLKDIISLFLKFLLLFSSVSYGSIIIAENFKDITLNINIISFASSILFLCSIILCIGVVLQGDR